MTLQMKRAVELDHLVVGCASLEQGEHWLQRLTGVSSLAGGRHPGWGTHNRLLRLDERTYLELIALDPSARENREGALLRPFGLDDAKLRERLAERPRLLHYVCRVKRLADDTTSAYGYDAGRVTAMTRGELSWRITMPGDERSAAARWRGIGRLQPALIEWSGGAAPVRHPLDQMVVSGVRLLTLRICAPAPLALPIELHGDPRIVFVSAAQPALGAEVTTPNGWRLID